MTRRVALSNTLRRTRKPEPDFVRANAETTSLHLLILLSVAATVAAKVRTSGLWVCRVLVDRPARFFDMVLQPSIPRFSSDSEQQFQASYYVRIRPTLRLVSGVLAVTLTVYLLLGWGRFAAFISVSSTPTIAFCLLLFGLTFVHSFGRVWQSATVALAWIASAAMLFWLARSQSGSVPRTVDAHAFVILSHLFFRLHICVLMVAMAALRLQFRPALALQSGVVAAGWLITLFVMPPDGDFWNASQRFAEPTLLVLLPVLLAAFVQEQLARSAFEANRHLALLQEQEHQKRLQTEGMLRVLNGAIGGIVHDLGNPLASVQMGAQTLEIFVEDGADKETLRLCTEAITSGAQMLNFLRLSLIEQSRVLEGKPVPVERAPVSIRAVVDAGVTFQKSRFVQGHTLSIEEHDFQIMADEMKMVTVLMNLIGNALKYSDGEVRITWRAQGDVLFLAVMDMGKAGRGLTREQAARLFTPFGRLETHANIEGTGLGLLSVQKIIEAHDGHIWIEGFEDGTPDSALFSTAPQASEPLLCSPFRTAFALTCPLAVGSPT